MKRGETWCDGLSDGFVLTLRRGRGVDSHHGGDLRRFERVGDVKGSHHGLTLAAEPWMHGDWTALSVRQRTKRVKHTRRESLGYE